MCSRGEAVCTLFAERRNDTLKRLVDVIKAALVALISKVVTVNVR